MQTSFVLPQLTSLDVRRLSAAVLLAGALAADAQERVGAGLVVLYTLDEGSGSVVYDTADAGTPIDLFIPPGADAGWIDGGLEIVGQALVRTSGPAPRVAQACRATNAVTVEAWVRPNNLSQQGPARIVAYSQDTQAQNLILAQDGSRLEGRLWTDGQLVVFNTLPGVLSADLTHLVMTADGNAVARLYVNSVEHARFRYSGNFDTWRSTDYLALGNEQTEDRLWLGELHLVAIYDRALSPQEVVQNFVAGPSAPSGATIDAGTADAGGGRTSPSFASLPPETIRCGVTYQYHPVIEGEGVFSFFARDGEGGAIPDDLYVNPKNGSVLWRPTAAQAGTHQFQLVASGPGGEAAQVVSVTVDCPKGAGLTVSCSSALGAAQLPGFAAVLLLGRRRRRSS